MDCAQEALDTWDSLGDGILSRLVTGDETWIYHHDPLTQAEAKEWRHSDSPPHPRPRMRKTAGKVMLTVFWDADGVLLTDFLANRRTITREYYASLLNQLREAINRDENLPRIRGIPRGPLYSSVMYF